MRPRKTDRQLPACVYRKHGAFYLVKQGKWTRLGDTLAGALAEYGRRTEAARIGGMAKLIEDGIDAIRPVPAPSTRKAYRYAAAKLHFAFDHFEPEQVKPRDIVEFKRGIADTPGMTNRCIHLLRQVFDYALEQGLVDVNPAVGIKSIKTSERTRLISDAEFARIYAEASEPLQIALDLWRLTGQRVVDVLSIRLADLRDTGIYFRQEKTSAELIVRWNPELRAAVDRARGRYSNVLELDRERPLLRNGRGKRPGYHAIYKQFTRAAKAAGVADVQIRDLRAVAVTKTSQQRGKAAAQAVAGHTTGQMTERYIREREIPVVDGPTFKVGS